MKVALVTGAGSGIGRATALKLAGMGYAVGLVGRTMKTLEETAAGIQSRGAGGGTGTQTLCVVADVSNADAVEGMVGKVEEAWGRVDVLVNNAGEVKSRALAELEVANWQRALEVNLSSAFYAIRAVWPIMRRQHEEAGAKRRGGEGGGEGGGVIVNISSMASKDPFPGLGAYAVAKAGLNMLSLMAAREGYEVGIRVVCVAPGSVDTPMLRGLMGEDQVRSEQVLRAEDVAAVIGDAVAGSLAYVSGETVFVHRRPA